MPKVFTSDEVLRTQKNERIRLEAASFARGGEGEIFRIMGNPYSVAKIYTNPNESLKHIEAKLNCLVQRSTKELRDRSAWPENLLYNPRNQIVGFTMPLVSDGINFSILYHPHSRKTQLPFVNWKFLIHACLNLAKVVADLHAIAIVIGDLNSNGVRVNDKAIVKLLDCDSFQVTEGTSVYLCGVNEPRYIAPEMIGRELKWTVRTANQDNFALAVMIFECLFMGRHPFDGRDLRSSESNTIDRVKAGRYAYGPSAASRGMQSPPLVLPTSEITPELQTMFERAFTNTTGSQPRPTAIDWYHALDRMEKSLVKCQADANHLYLKSSSSCPWCRLESNGLESFFHGVPNPMGGASGRPYQSPQPGQTFNGATGASGGSLESHLKKFWANVSNKISVGSVFSRGSGQASVNAVTWVPAGSSNIPPLVQLWMNGSTIEELSRHLGSSGKVPYEVESAITKLNSTDKPSNLALESISILMKRSGCLVVPEVVGLLTALAVDSSTSLWVAALLGFFIYCAVHSAVSEANKNAEKGKQEHQASVLKCETVLNSLRTKLREAQSESDVLWGRYAGKTPRQDEINKISFALDGLIAKHASASAGILALEKAISAHRYR